LDDITILAESEEDAIRNRSPVHAIDFNNVPALASTKKVRGISENMWKILEANLRTSIRNITREDRFVTFIPVDVIQAELKGKAGEKDPKRMRTIATDGSFSKQTEQAEIGVSSEEGISIAGRIPGKQTVPRAEAFALLIALQYASATEPVMIHTDSKINIDALKKLSTSNITEATWESIKNMSIWMAFWTKIQNRSAPITYRKVRAHTQGRSKAELLNKEADRLTKRAAEGGAASCTSSFQRCTPWMRETRPSKTVWGERYIMRSAEPYGRSIRYQLR
jgi:ribonuclease HI